MRVWFLLLWKLRRIWIKLKRIWNKTN
jgi:hypothetical protein